MRVHSSDLSDQLSHLQLATANSHIRNCEILVAAAYRHVGGREKNAGEEGRARARAGCALDDIRRAWRNTFFVRHYEIREPAGAAEPLLALAPAVVVPAGCVLIDSALGEIPPPIFGPPVHMVFPPEI